MKSVLVLGATGFVGTHVSLALFKEQVHLVLACRETKKLHPELQGCEVRMGDIRDEAYLCGLFLGIDVVINAFAWTSMYGHQEESNEQLYKPTLRLIDAAKLSGVRRFINLSSVSVTNTDEVYEANNRGKLTRFWPHLDNVIAIENYLRNAATDKFGVINLRCGHFIGEHYGIGLLPILLPRLKTHMVPWIERGLTRIPLIVGEDIAQAFVKSVNCSRDLEPFESFDIIGPETPWFKDVLEFIHDEFGYPLPHFNVPFGFAHVFGYLMEILDPIVPCDPLVTRSIVHLLKETGTDNTKASRILGYEPKMDWKETIKKQILEIQAHQQKPMKMTKEVL